jgi:ribose 5-phosphate isomerase B
MKRFDLVTEADARVLAWGETIELAHGGHITPLARDTLRERRVTIVGDDVITEEDALLAPTPSVRSVALGSDHTGIAMRSALAGFLRSRGLAVEVFGAAGAEAVDYPDVAASVARQVARGEADAGIVIDGAGIGSAIAANKIAGIRAAMATTEAIARYSREHNGANVLTLGVTLVTIDQAKTIVDAWLGAVMQEPRYIRRLAKIRALEEP